MNRWISVLLLLATALGQSEPRTFEELSTMARQAYDADHPEEAAQLYGRAVKLRPGWSRIRAVREGRVCALEGTDGEVVMRPGPRLADAARILARCLSR